MASSPRRSSASFGPGVGRKASQVRERSRPAMILPDRFRDTEDDDEDDGTGVGNENADVLPQASVYGMLAAAQSRSRFPTQQPDSASESEAEEKDREDSGQGILPSRGKALGTRITLDPRQIRHESKVRRKEGPKKPMAKSWFTSSRARSPSEARNHDLMTQSQILPPRQSAADEHDSFTGVAATRPGVRILDQKLRAMVNAQMDSRGTEQSSSTSRGGTAPVERLSKTLPEVIANIFRFEEAEDIIAEYPCWYLQNVLLQGFMYITKKHVCFYAYLQKKTNVILKSGHLGKQSKHGYAYARYFFVLKGDIFAYYKDASQPYFPNNQLDLRYAISAEVTDDDGRASSDFTIKTHERTYFYRADNDTSAKDWVKQLQKVIFRSHNDGDSVKISLHLGNILAVDRNPMVESAETVKIRVIDNDETYAIDEYFFTFFNDGQDAVNVLTTFTEGNGTRSNVARADEYDKSSGRALVSPTPLKATRPPQLKSPGLSPRDRGRRVSNTSRESPELRGVSQSSLPPSFLESCESIATSSEALQSIDGDDVDAHMSASQMLSDDGLFRGPTLRHPQPREPLSANEPSRLRQISRSPSDEHVRVQPPTRTNTDQSLVNVGPLTEQYDSKIHDTLGSNRGMRVIAAPLQHAMSVAGLVRSQSKRMSSFLGSSPKTYIDKWSDAYAGGKRMYTDSEGFTPDDSVVDLESGEVVEAHEKRFREHFGLPQSEKLVATYYCWLHGNVPFYGKIYMGTTRFCFRSLFYGTRSRIVLPFKEIVNVQQQRGFRWRYPGMVLVLRGHEELFFDFSTAQLRDDCSISILRRLEAVDVSAESMFLTTEQQQQAEDAAAENEQLQVARKRESGEHDVKLPPSLDRLERESPRMLVNDFSTEGSSLKSPASMRIVCLTIGSRGDVQPYIALCKGLLAQGHKAKIATHAEFGDWVKSHGIEFEEVAGDPADLMRICVEKGMFTPAFFLEANSNFRSWLDGLLESAWEACQGADLLIESPSAMCGIHIAEALEIPYFRAFTMPWSRTRTYPHAFAVPNNKMGGGYNYMSYTLFDNIFWQAIAGQINRWRGNALGLGPTSLDKMQQNRVPFLYNFSPSVVIPPLDFSDWIKVTGYWFLDEGKDWSPPTALTSFIRKARDDGMKLVYIGFGSVTVADSRQLTQQIVEAVKKADVRCILSKGWSDRFEKQDASKPEIELPACIHQIRSAPHDWLFQQIDAVVIHGGAGTTGAALRAGKPTIIKPFFGDQYFFATRVEDLGVGLHIKKVTANQLGKALWVATHDGRMALKARALGEAIRREDGVQTAIAAIYQDLAYARSLIKTRAVPHRPGSASMDVATEDSEENWTFVERDEEIETLWPLEEEEQQAAATAAGPRKSIVGRGLRLGSVLPRR